MNVFLRGILIAVSSAAVFPAQPAAAQSDASSITLLWSISEACGENMECRTAVEQQFADCLEQSAYEEFLRAETEEQETYYLALTMQALAACITDDQGEPYFQTRNGEDAPPADEAEDDAP